jgi:class 3 adenylate cyclase/CHASE2 domain-containing sensor protein
VSQALLVRGGALLGLAGALWMGAGRLGSALGKMLGVPEALAQLLVQLSAVAAGVAAVVVLRGLFRGAVHRVVAPLDALEARLTARLGAFWGRVASALPFTVITALVLVLLRPTFAGAEGRVVDAWYGFLFPRQTIAQRALDVDAARPKGLRDDIVIVDMDNDTLARLGYPLPRKYHAQLIQVLHEAGARSIIFDVTFQDPSRDHPEWDAQMATAAKNAGNVYLAYPMVEGGGDRLPADLDAALARTVIPANPGHQPLMSWELMSGGDQHPDLPIGGLTKVARGLGPVNLLLDEADDIMRHATIGYQLKDRLYPSLVTRAALDILAVPPDSLRMVAGDALYLGDKRIPVDVKGRTLLRFHARHLAGANTTFPYVPFYAVVRREFSFRVANNPLGEDQVFLLTPATQVKVNGKVVPLDEVDGAALTRGVTVTGRADITADPARVQMLDILVGTAAPEEPRVDMVDEGHMEFTAALGEVKRRGPGASTFKDKHVLVGASATGAADLRTTPLGQVPGVEVQATLLNNLLNHDVMEHAAPRVTLLLVLLLALLLALLAGPGSPAVLAGGTVVLVLGSVVGAFLSFTRGLHVETVPPVGTLLGGFSALILQGYRRERAAKAHAEESRSFIRQTFGRYLTDQVVDALLSSPEGLKFGGERRTVTILMTDLRGFTSMSAKLEPEAVVKILNNYLAVMTDIVVKYGGTIDEFIGDAILVVFGAPFAHEDDAARAVSCAVEMLCSMPKVNEWNRLNNLPEVSMGIGINTGEVVVGNIGSERRAKYAIVGTPINMCARVESYTVGGQVLVSDLTRQAAGDVLDVRDSMVVSPKGLPKPITIHDIRGVKAPYNVALPEAPEELHPLPKPGVFRFTILAGKHAGADLYDGTMRMLSMQGMELETDRELEALDNVKGQVLDSNGEPLGGDLYGKVVKPKTDAGFTYVRFTSIPDGHKTYLETLHKAAAVAEHAPQGVPMPDA